MRGISCAILAGVVAWTAATAWAAPKPKPQPRPYVLESPTLRLEVTPTYSYRVIEKATGLVLVNQNLTTFSFGSSSYSASSITGVTIDPGVALSGNLPLGNKTTAKVQFAFTTPDTLQVTLSNTGTPTAIAERFKDNAERYYGVWENALPNALDNRGVSAGYDGREPLGTYTKDVFAASARAPFYLTNRNYGIYANTQAQGSYTFAQSGNTSFKFNGASLQYDILHAATPKGIIAQHNTIAGPAFMPPDWAFSTIFWRDDFHQLPSGNPGITNAQSLVLDDAAKFQQNQIPAGTIWIDRPYGTGSQDSNVAGWGNMDFDASFPNPSQMVQDLQGKGTRLLLWAANKASNGMYTEGTAAGYLFSGYSNSPAVDLRNTSAYAWFQGKLNTLQGKAVLADGTTGIRGFKLDRGGEGEMPDALINTETTLFQKMAYEQLQASTGGDFFQFARNINGQGRQYAAVWSGDAKCTWLGLQTSVKNGLRAGLANFPMWGSDTGGYAGGPPTQELFSRWVAFSAYSPMMEIVQGPGRNIFYDFSSQTVDITRKYTQLHHDLIPLTRSLLAESLRSGAPIMRPMFVEFPADAAVADTWDQYMYGPNLLVAPVMSQGASSRSVYLPMLPSGGRWMDYNTKRATYAGGQAITAAAPIDTVPVYVREGAIIPRGDIVKVNNNWTANWSPSLRIEVFPSESFASSFDYWTGSTMQTITATPLAGEIEVSFGDLLVSGLLELYLTQPTAVVLNGTALVLGQDCFYDPATDRLTVPFGAGGPTTLDVLGAHSLFGTTATLNSLAVAVPEPATLAMAAAGGLLVCRRHGARRPDPG